MFSQVKNSVRANDFILDHCEFSGSFVRCPDEYNCFWTGYLEDDQEFLPTIGAFYEKAMSMIEEHIREEHP